MQTMSPVWDRADQRRAAIFAMMFNAEIGLIAQIVRTFMVQLRHCQ